MAQANNRGFNQDYSCANSREFLPYFLLVSHWMPEWIWAKQGWQMGNKNWSKIWQRLRIQPVMRQFDVCSATKKYVSKYILKKIVCFHLVKTFKIIFCPQMSGQNQRRSVLFRNSHIVHTASDHNQSQALTTQIILIWLNLYQFPSEGG